MIDFYRIVTEAQESEEEFIFTTIQPFCEDVIKRKISKTELVKLLSQPKIVRCGECKWYGRADKRRFYRGMDCLQKRIDTIVPDRDYCSRAERRANDEIDRC